MTDNITLEELDTKWNDSEYEDEIYYFHERDCEPGATAYLYHKFTQTLEKLEIIKCIARSENMESYDQMDNDCLIDGESEYEADTSCEFITDKDCYLVWFKYTNE